MEFCCTCPGVELLSPLWSQAHCAPWWKIYSLRSQMMMIAPLEKRQQSKQTQSAGIPGGNKSGRKMFVVFLPSMFGIFVCPPFGERNQSDGAMHERKVWEKERKGRCVEYSAQSRDTESMTTADWEQNWMRRDHRSSKRWSHCEVVHVELCRC